MASGHLTIDLHTQGQPPGCLPLGPRLAPRLAPGSPPPRRERGRSLFPSVLSEGNRLQVRPTRLPRAPALHSHRAAAATFSLHSLHLGEPATASSSCANAFPRRAHRLRPRRRPLCRSSGARHASASAHLSKATTTPRPACATSPATRCPRPSERASGRAKRILLR